MRKHPLEVSAGPHFILPLVKTLLPLQGFLPRSEIQKESAAEHAAGAVSRVPLKALHSAYAQKGGSASA